MTTEHKIAKKYHFEGYLALAIIILGVVNIFAANKISLSRGEMVGGIFTLTWIMAPAVLAGELAVSGILRGMMNLRYDFGEIIAALLSLVIQYHFWIVFYVEVVQRMGVMVYM